MPARSSVEDCKSGHRRARRDPTVEHVGVYADLKVTHGELVRERQGIWSYELKYIFEILFLFTKFI